MSHNLGIETVVYWVLGQ